MNISKCFLTNSDIDGEITVSPNSGRNLLFVYSIDFYGERKKMRVCHDLSKGFVTKNNEILSISDIDNDNIQCYLLHFLFEVSKEQFEPLFANKLHFGCNPEGEGNLSVVSFIENLYPALPDIPKSEEKMKMLLKAIYDERGIDDLSEISFVNDFKFRAKSYMIDSKELNRYLEELEEDRLIKINGKSVRLRRKGLDYIKNGFKLMANNNNSINGNNNTVVQNLGDNANLNLTQNIGNTFSQENKNDIREIIQFLKKDVENLNLSNDDVTDIKNEVQILESQISRENPKKERINSALGIIQSMLTSITANLYTPKVEAIVNKIGGLIGNVPIG